MRKLPLLVLAIGVAVTALLIDGHAGRHTLGIRVHTPRSELLVTRSPAGTVVAPAPSAPSSLFANEDAGAPAVPFRIVEVLVPSGRTVVSVRAAARATETIARDVTPARVAPPSAPPDDPRTPMNAPLASVGGDEYPSELVRYLGTGTWHGYSIASFAVFPVRVRGGAIALASDIELEIELTTSAETVDAVRMRRASAWADVESQVAARVANPDAMRSYPSPRPSEHGGRLAPTSAPSEDGSPVDYLIITTDSLASSFQTLADWKTAKGVMTQVRTVSWIEANGRHGSDLAETIRFFLQDAYTNWGVRYVLLGGDAPEIPPRYLYSAYHYGGTLIPGDLYFAALDGTYNADGDSRFGEQPADAPDLYAELMLGRIPVSTAQDANAIIAKIISYETPLDAEYSDKVLMLAEVLFPSPWSSGPIILNGGDVTDVSYILHVQSPDRRVARLYETPQYFPGSLPLSRAIAIDSLSAGASQVFHVGHGFRFNMHCADDNVAIPDADAFYHPDRYYNLYMLNCTAAAFDYDCLGEHLLRNPNGGAVTIVGAVNSAFAQAAASYLDLYTVELYENNNVRVGDALASSRSARTPFAMTGDNVDLWTHYIYTILGDPELPTWNARVRVPQVALPASVPAGDVTIQVMVTVDAAPALGAVVCLRKGNEDYRVGETDASGMATIPFGALTPGTIDVVVTGLNLARISASIAVTAPTGPIVDVGAVSIDDDAIDGTSGNGDGKLDAGETVDLLPTLHNYGTDSLTTLTLTLTTNHAQIAVIDADAEIAGLAPGESQVAGDAWRMVVAAAVPDAATVSFDVAIKHQGSIWSDSFARVVHAPALEVTELRVSDAPPVGNGDGVVSAGEEFLLFATLKNFGSGTASGLTAVLRSLDGGATMIDSLSAFADVPPLASAECAPGFRLSEANTTVENALELVVTDVRGVAFPHAIELRRPSPPLLQSFDPGLGVDRMGITWNASTSPDLRGYHVYRSLALTGPFVRASSDIVANSFFTDTGLSPSTRYYYVATTVDESGNESVFSPVAFASTTPAQLLGWPQQLVDPSANSPTLGDIDGDGNLDVVVGNDRMYAWKFDGDEIHDGDGVPLTWGVLSSLGDDFIGAAALADFDGQPGLEIAAAAYTSKQVFVFNHLGQALPGWPRPTIDLVRAAVAIGNLDGDSDFEIFAVDHEGYLYAWHHDGSEVIDGDANPATNGVFVRLPDTNQWQYQGPAIADLDGDGMGEVIIATQDKKVYVFDHTGAIKPNWPRTLPNFAGGGVVVGDLDNNGDLEIVVTTRSSGETYALNHDNTVMWLRWVQTNQFFNPSPSLADLTGDGKLEAIIPSSNGQMYAIQYNGNDAPGWPVVYASTYTESSPVIADITGDGIVDVLLGDESKRINAWSAAGVYLDGFPLVLKDSVRGTPAVADLDYDGKVNLIAVGFDKTVYVWDMPAPYHSELAPWPMYRANVHHDGVHASDEVTPVPGARAARFALGQNYPNPFNPTTTIAFELSAAGPVSLVIYDVTGARVRTLVDGPMISGPHRAQWDGHNDTRQPVGSGVYFYRLAAGGNVLTKKMVLLK